MKKYFLGTAINDKKSSDILEMLAQRMASGVTRIFVTPNLDHVVRNYQDEKLKDLYDRAWLSVNDSKIIPILAPLDGISIKNTTAGSDITKCIFESGMLKDYRVAVVGCEYESVDSVMKSWGVQNYRHYNPPMGFIHNQEQVEACIEFVINAQPNITFLCVGSPQQEILAGCIERKSEESGLLMCVGASLDFLSGRQKRAPFLIQQLCLEWFYRFCLNPRKLAARYFIRCPKVLMLLAVSFYTKHVKK